MQDHDTRRMLLASAATLFQHIESETREGVESRYNAADVAVDLLATTLLTQSRTLRQRLEQLPILTQMLQDHGGFSQAYVGYGDGQSILVGRLTPGSLLMPSLNPPANAAYLVRSVAEVAPGRLEGRFLFFDLALQQLEDRPMPDYKFDPRGRPWFRRAIEYIASETGATTKDVERALNRMVMHGKIVLSEGRYELCAGVYREFAETFLRPEQIDEVDLAKYLHRATGDAAPARA